MRGQVAKAERRVERRTVELSVDGSVAAVRPAIQGVLDYARGLEKKLAHAEAILHRGFFGRLRWLLTGK